jgi:hypothetical protein
VQSRAMVLSPRRKSRSCIQTRGRLRFALVLEHDCAILRRASQARPAVFFEVAEPMEANAFTHVAFADESSYNTHRYRSIGLITLPQVSYAASLAVLQQIVTESGVPELKWLRLDSAQMRFAIERMLNYIVEQAACGALRVDVLIWDVEDSRHRVAGRDDIANLHRMYYHLFRNVLHRRWPSGSIWRLHPDQNSAMDWHHVGEQVDGAGLRFEIEGNLLTPNNYQIQLRRDFHIEQIVSCVSHQQPLVQVADVFAGMAVYSWRAYATYERWQQHHGPQVNFLEAGAKDFKLSQADRERCYILAQFNALCKRHRLGVSLKTQRGLITHDPARPINFWRYVPQHEQDKAPTRSRA